MDERTRLCKKKKAEEGLTRKFCALGSVARAADDYLAILVLWWT